MEDAAEISEVWVAELRALDSEEMSRDADDASAEPEEMMEEARLATSEDMARLAELAAELIAEVSWAAA